MTRYVDINNRRGRLNRDREVEQGWDSISRSWRNNWQKSARYHWPSDIRKAIFTTNGIESLNSVIRQDIKNVNYFCIIIGYKSNLFSD